MILNIQELSVERDENKINIWELDLKSSNTKVQLELSKWLTQDILCRETDKLDYF